MQTICIQPPSLSVGVRHLGQGFVETLIVTLLASSQRASAARYYFELKSLIPVYRHILFLLTLGSTAYSQLVDVLPLAFSGRQSPK